MANEIVSLYLNENLRNRTQMAEETSSFLGDESERLKSKIEEFERKLADFKERNVERLPELSQLNLQLMDRTEREMVEVERQIQALKERRIYLESELAQLHPMDKIISETGERILSPADRLKVLKTQYISASAVYAPSHPDVVKLTKEIKALEAETGGSPDLGEMTQRLEGVRADLATAEQKYSPTHPDVKKLRRAVVALEEELQEAAQRPPDTAPPPKPDNPAYIQIQAQLDAADTELRSHQNKHQRLQSKLESFEERLTQTPQVEREYRALTRDYENALAKYREIKAKEMEARLAEALEAGRKGERFTLIEAPLMPEKPVKPNRLAIMFLGVVFSVAGGLGSAAVAESLDSSVRGARSVSALLGAPPLGVIPYIENRADRRHRLSKRILIMVVLLGLAVITLALFHWLVMPLDVAWYVALRKLEPFLGGG
ncbi:MAG: lipopolysaccharide biosynthesis protein [Gammaproteobacteria bacterium]|nr:lipopolysaccharide biosynthesis protein [Gammaproteobacteria bacterium]